MEGEEEWRDQEKGRTRKQGINECKEKGRNMIGKEE